MATVPEMLDILFLFCYYVHGGDQLAPLKPEAALDFDTFFDFGDWLGVPSVECKERILIVRAKVLHHLGVSCIARVYD